MVFKPNYTVSLDIARALIEIEESKDDINKRPLSVKLLDSLRKSARLITTHYSTQIEGNQLTMDQIEQVIFQQGGFAGRERDEMEVSNYYKALNYIEKLPENSFSEENIRTIHSLAMNGKTIKSSYRDGQNVIRDGSNGVIVYLPPEAKDVPTLMKNLVEWVTQSLDKKLIPIPIVAAITHYQIATIHPYYDGNGRTARLVTTLILQKFGYGLKGIYSLEEYYANNIIAYYNALAVDDIPNYYMGRAEADITGFVRYFIDAMARSFSKINQHSLLSRSNKLKKNTAKLRDLSPQQKAIMSLFIEQKYISSKEIAQFIGITNRSTRSLITKWIKSGFIRIHNPSNKSRTYKLNSYWEDYLAYES